MYVYQMYDVLQYLWESTIHRTGMEHFTRLSPCCHSALRLKTGSLQWNLIVALVPYCAGYISWTEICGVSGFLPYLTPQPVIIRTYWSAVIVGKLTPDWQLCTIIQDTVCL